MKSWITHGLILAATFSCAAVVLAYRDYAKQKTWPVGRWDFSDSSWIKILAVVATIGCPLIALYQGPWWLFFVVPIFGFSVAIVAANLLREFVQPIAILGLVIGWFLSVWTAWPTNNLPDNWTKEEIENAEYILDSANADRSAINMANSAGFGVATEEETSKYFGLKQTALEYARQVHDDVLVKVHAELPYHFRQEYQRSLELMLEAFENGDNTKSLQAVVLHDKWVDWWNANKKDIRIPRT